MKSPLNNLEDRQIVLMWITGAVVACALIAQGWLLPALEDLKSARSLARAQQQKYARLKENIKIRQRVDQQFGTLHSRSFQRQSDQITLSGFLRDLESMARHPSLTLVNMKPMPVKNEGSFKTYRIRLAVAGTIQDILRFVSDLTGQDYSAGVESFSLRGIQGGRMAECSLSIRMIRLVSEPPRESPDTAGRQQEGLAHAGQ
jgi:hypothetical protein